MPRPARGQTLQRQGSRHAVRREQGAKILELIGRPNRRPWTNYENNCLASPQLWCCPSTATKKHSLKIESTKTETGDRLYQIRK